MTQEFKSDWKMKIGIIAFAVFYLYLQYKLTEIIESIPK